MTRRRPADETGLRHGRPAAHRRSVRQSRRVAWFKKSGRGVGVRFSQSALRSAPLQRCVVVRVGRRREALRSAFLLGRWAALSGVPRRSGRCARRRRRQAKRTGSRVRVARWSGITQPFRSARALGQSGTRMARCGFKGEEKRRSGRGRVQRGVSLRASRRRPSLVGEPPAAGHLAWSLPGVGPAALVAARVGAAGAGW